MYRSTCSDIVQTNTCTGICWSG